MFLQWRLSGADQRGRFHQHLGRGTAPIEFPHLRVALAHQVELQMPREPMLCMLTLEACTAGGNILARNFVHFLVSATYPTFREEQERGLILRVSPSMYSAGIWSGQSSDHPLEEQEDLCFGSGHGFFEWALALKREEYLKLQRIRMVIEASSHRAGSPQTDEDIFPTTMQLLLNGVVVYQAILRNHPHDARGTLSYLRGERGAYGYLIHAFAEGDLLKKILANANDEVLRLRCAVPREAVPRGGLTIYGAECGRYPVCPTLILEW